MVSSYCGVPLVQPWLVASRYRTANKDEKFLPYSTCLGDVLSNDGYRSHYIIGAGVEPQIVGRAASMVDIYPTNIRL